MFRLNHRIRHTISLPVVISVTLILSFCTLPLAQAQEFYYISVWSQFGIKQTSLSLPEGIAVDPSTGNVYVADTANNRIQVFSRDGTFLSKWGRYGSITNGTLRSPTGIAVDQAGT